MFAWIKRLFAGDKEANYDCKITKDNRGYNLITLNDEVRELLIKWGLRETNNNFFPFGSEESSLKRIEWVINKHNLKYEKSI